MSYSLRKEQIIQDVEEDEDGGSDVPELASEGSDYSGSDDEGPPPRAPPRASNGAGAAARAPAAGGRAAPRAAAASAGADDMPGLEEDEDEPPGLASAGEEDEGVDSYHSESDYTSSDGGAGSDGEPPALEDDMPRMMSDTSAEDSEDEPAYIQRQRTQQPQQAQRTPGKAAPAAAAGAGKKGAAQPKAKKASPKGGGDSDGDEDAIPGLLSDAASSDHDTDDDEREFLAPPRSQAKAAGAAKPGSGFATGYFKQGQDKKADARSRTTYGGEGAGRREDLRGPRATSAGPADQFEAAQQQAQKARQRKPAPAAAPVVVEKVVAEVAQDEKIREALRLEEEERKAMRKKLGLDEDEEAEVEDPVLGPCGYGELCSKDPETHAVKTSHANRYEFRCSAGHKLFYHRECWLKATVRWVDLKGQEHEKEGRDFKFNSYKKEHRRKCILPDCEGIVTFIEGPNKYGILNIEEEVRKEQAGQEEKEEELPEWERYKRQERQERRFRFKKGKAKKAADDEEEEEAAPQPAKRGGRHSLDEDAAAVQRERQQAEAGGAGAASTAPAAAAEEAEEPSAPTPALPDDQLLRAFKRESSEDELMGLGKGRKGKEKGKPAAKEVADIVYEDGAGGKKKKGKGVKLLLGAGLSIAEQRRLQHQQAAAGGLEAAEGSQRPQRLADSLLEFPDLQEAAQLSKEKHEDEEQKARQMYSSALLGALRSYRAEADDLRPDDPHGPSTVLVENLDFKKMRDEEGTRPEMFLRSTFAEYGPVKDLRMYEACRAAIVSFRSTAAAYKAFVLLSQKTLLHSRLSAIMLKKWPKEAEVEELAQRKLEEEQRRREEGLWEDEEAAAAASLASASYLLDDRPSSSASGGRAPLFVEHGRASPAGAPSLSITIPGSGSARGGAAAGGGAGGSGSGPAAVGSQGSSLGGSLKVNAPEFVPGGFASPALAVSPHANSVTAAAAAAAEAAANAVAGLRVAANEFRPGGPAAGTAGAAGTAAEAEDPLLNQFLSGQLIQANNATLDVYLSQGDQQFGIQSMYMERVGVVSKGQVALLMYNQDTRTLHGVWSADHKEHANTPDELVAFQRERQLPPLDASAVHGYLQWQGGAVRLPQKIAAANIKSIMRAFVELERSQQAIGRTAATAAVAAAAGLAAAMATAPAAAAAAAPSGPQSAQAASGGTQGARRSGSVASTASSGTAQQAQQAQQGGDWWAEQERRRREQEEADAELARQLQEQLLAEAQLERERQAAEDARLAAALQSSARAAAQAAPQAQPSGWAAAAARPAAPPPPPPAAAAAPAAGPPRPPGVGGGIFASLFPGQRAPGAPAPPAAAAVPRGPSPGAGAPRPYRPPAMGGYRPPMGPAVAAPAPPAAAPAASLAAAAPAAPAFPAAAAPAVAPAPAAPAAPATAAPAAPAAPAALKNPCVACKERESVHIWIPCGHHGHCQACLGDEVAKEEKLARFPACLVCSRKAEYYIRVFN